MLPKAEYRGKQCLLYDVGSALCDRGLESGWYAVRQNNKYVEMPTSCPSTFSCDTAAPIWLNGTLCNYDQLQKLSDHRACQFQVTAVLIAYFFYYYYS